MGGIDRMACHSPIWAGPAAEVATKDRSMPWVATIRGRGNQAF